MSVHGRRRSRLHQWLLLFPPSSNSAPPELAHLRAKPQGVSAGRPKDAGCGRCWGERVAHREASGKEVVPHPVIEKSTWHFRRAQQGIRRLEDEVMRPSGIVVVGLVDAKGASLVVNRRHTTSYNLPDETHNSRQPRRGSSFAHRPTNFSRQVPAKLDRRALPIGLSPSTCALGALTTRLLLLLVGLYSAVLLVASCQSPHAAQTNSDSHPRAAPEPLFPAPPSSRPASHQFTRRLSSRSSDYSNQWTLSLDPLSPRVDDREAEAEKQLHQLLHPETYAKTTVTRTQRANKQHHHDSRRERRRKRRNKTRLESMLLDLELHNNYLNDETSLLQVGSNSEQSGAQTTLDLPQSTDEIEYRNWIGGGQLANNFVCQRVHAGNGLVGPNHAESCRMGNELWAKLCSITFSRDFSNQAHVICQCCAPLNVAGSKRRKRRKKKLADVEGGAQAQSPKLERYLAPPPARLRAPAWAHHRNDNHTQPLGQPVSPAAAAGATSEASEAASAGSQWRRARASSASSTSPTEARPGTHTDTGTDNETETETASTSTTNHLNTIVYLMSNLLRGIHPTLPIALILGAIILVTFIGNVLVCLSVIKVRKLRHPSNYLLVSLAISDLCVGCVVMPFGLYQVINDNWQLGRILCNVYVVSDVTSCTASILNLCVISIDRYLAITQPLTYCVKRTSRLMLILIAFVWICACLISVPPLLISGNEYGSAEQPKCEVSQSLWYQLYATCISFYIPLIVMICLYFNIYTAAKRVVEAERRATTGLHINHSTEPPTSVMRERKASITLGIIMTAFTVCWLPFFIMALLRPFSETIDKLPRTYVLLTLWLGYANSLLNPIIYVTFHRDFRNAFKHLLCITKKNSSILNNNNNHSSNKQGFA